MVHNYLYRFDAKVNLHPDLATNYTQSKDGLSWTFTSARG